ncbi:MAG TPA: N-acetylmuramoyl-L-alanine amidase [Desulfuromonadales bacterium]|nr:N-acetylmuramoyl-L-alanine amidase [Desulfuromonadales bacterium]
MIRYIILFFIFLSSTASALAAIELGRAGDAPQRIEEVYLLDGTHYLDIEEALDALDIKGDWDSVEHVYRFHTAAGQAEFYPGGNYLVVGQRYIPLDRSPRFIDGRLRIPENFITDHLSNLVDDPIYYRNFDPPQVSEPDENGGIDGLFSFLLRKKEKKTESPISRALAIDPGHGGTDPGVLGPADVKEKNLNLAVAEELEKLVKMELGVPVYLTRDRDYRLSRKERFETAARSGVDAFILLHAQASFDPSLSGATLVIRSDAKKNNSATQKTKGGNSRRLAEEIKGELESRGFVVNGIIEAPLLPLGRGNLPTVLVEMGYLSNPEDLRRLKDPEQQQRLAHALFAGIRKFNTTMKEAEQ